MLGWGAVWGSWFGGPQFWGALGGVWFGGGILGVSGLGIQFWGSLVRGDVRGFLFFWGGVHFRVPTSGILSHPCVCVPPSPPQLLALLAVEDEPVLGYTAPTPLTQLHLHLCRCALDYRSRGGGGTQMSGSVGWGHNDKWSSFGGEGY